MSAQAPFAAFTIYLAIAGSTVFPPAAAQEATIHGDRTDARVVERVLERASRDADLSLPERDVSIRLDRHQDDSAAIILPSERETIGSGGLTGALVDDLEPSERAEYGVYESVGPAGSGGPIGPTTSTCRFACFTVRRVTSTDGSPAGGSAPTSSTGSAPYGHLKVLGDGSSNLFYYVRQDHYLRLSKGSTDLSFLSGVSSFGPHATGSEVRVKQGWSYYVFPVCTSSVRADRYTVSIPGNAGVNVTCRP